MQPWVVLSPATLCCAAVLCCYPLLLSPTLCCAAEDNIWQGPALPCACPLPPPASATQVPRSTDDVCLFIFIFNIYLTFSHCAFFYICLTVSFQMCSKMTWKSACLLVLLKCRHTEICFNILSGSFFLFQSDHNKVKDHLAL